VQGPTAQPGIRAMASWTAPQAASRSSAVTPGRLAGTHSPRGRFARLRGP
jgi:hypothetical protein